MLELNKLTAQVDGLADALVDQRTRLGSRADRARSALLEHAKVTDELLEKLELAVKADPSWRGAEPLGKRLDELHQTPPQQQPATLIASDGSQIYPDTHAFALYYLTNVGTMVLRQGSGQAPDTTTDPVLKIAEDDPSEEQDGDRIDTDEVNAQRDLREVQALAVLARKERAALGGDMERLLVALADGPLLPWMPQRLTDTEQAQRVKQFTAPLDTLRAAYVVPVGYVDRPRSANLLRLLHLAGLPPDAISKERLRKGNPYFGLSDRALFPDLAPGQRTGLFATTAEINESYRQQQHRIVFCYMNVAHEATSVPPILVRIETPEWMTADPTRLDDALAAVWSDCRLMQYPYILARAHELALVTRQERDSLEQMLRIEMVRRGLTAEGSAKAGSKRVARGR